MPDIALLEPRVINGVVQKFFKPQNFLGLQLVGAGRPSPDMSWSFDILQASRNLATINTPGAVGKIVNRLVVGSISGGFVYVREKKVFDPVTLHWLREPGELAAKNAEAEVLRELQDLALRIDRLHEMLVWKMLTGQLDYTRDNTTVSINYLMAASHKPVAATFWNDPNADPMANIFAWKRLIARDGHATPDRVYLNSQTMHYLMNNAKVLQSLSNAQKERHVAEGVLYRFQGLDFVEYDLGYMDDFTDPNNPTFTYYIPDGRLIMMASEGDPIFWLDGPSADDSAPHRYTGRFTKTWKEEDPSARQVLMEQNGIPIMTRPEQFVYAQVA